MMAVGEVPVESNTQDLFALIEKKGMEEISQIGAALAAAEGGGAGGGDNDDAEDEDETAEVLVAAAEDSK